MVTPAYTSEIIPPKDVEMTISSVMEGKGAYNKYAKLPADGAALALPLLEKAIQNAKLELGDRPVIIADYGSSQGKNSLVPMRFAIRHLRPRIGENRPILVFHIDQSTNDFNSLFEVLATDPDRYAQEDPLCFPVRLADRSTKACSPRKRSTSAGAPRRPCGSAAFRH